MFSKIVYHLRKKLSFEARVVLAGTMSFITIQLKEVVHSQMVNGLGVVLAIEYELVMLG